MGNAQSSNEESYAKLIAQYNVVKQFQDQRLGDLTILQEKLTKEEVLLREINSNDEFQFNKIMQTFNQRKKLVHPNIIQLLGLTNKVDQQFCATFFQTYVLFEYVTNNLEREIYARKTNNKHFAEGELYTLIQQCVSAMAYLQANNVQHQNIRPNTIYITKKGTIKMTDPMSFQQEHNFSSLLIRQGEHNSKHFIYLSPLLLKALEKSDYHPSHNSYQSDVFTLGMTLLHAGLLESMETCYTFSDFKFHEDVQHTKLNALRLIYDPTICDIIAQMIEWDEAQRPDFINLERFISRPSTPVNEPPPKESPPQRPPSPPQRPYVPSQAPVRINVKNNNQQPSIKPPPPPVSVNKPTMGAQTMTADQDDWINPGLNGVPRDLISLKATPDENIGNDLGRGTAKDDNPLLRDSNLPNNQNSSIFPGFEKDNIPYQPIHQNPYEDLPPYSNTHHPMYDDHHPQIEEHQYSPEVEKILSKYNNQNNNNNNPDKYGGPSSYNPPFTSYQPPITVPDYNSNMSDIFKKYGLSSNQNPNDYRPSAPVETRPPPPSNSFNPYNSGINDPYRSTIGNASNIKPYIHREFVVETYSNGSKYEGQKLEGMRDGRGQFYYQDGGMYHGEWRENQMHGRGILYYSSGKPAYDGEWKNDLFEGRGILYNQNPISLPTSYDYRDFDLVEDYWIKYDGEFKDDNQEGHGTLYFSNQEQFVGLFQKDFVTGQGTFYKKNGQTVKGNWKNNQLIMETIVYK